VGDGERADSGRETAMCGRYVSVKARADLLTEVRAEGPELRESYNVAVSGSAAWQSVPRRYVRGALASGFSHRSVVRA
jgi:hypothetical protein